MEGREEKRGKNHEIGENSKGKGKKEIFERKKRNVLTSMMARVILPLWTLEK